MTKKIKTERIASIKVENNLAAILKESKVRVSELSRKTELSKDSLYKIKNDPSVIPSLTTILIIADELKINFCRLIKKKEDEQH